jgi:hypothetical protein
LNFSGKVASYEGPGTALDELCALAPEAIAAPLQRALDLADARMKGLVDLPSLSCAVVVLTDVSGAPRSAAAGSALACVSRAGFRATPQLGWRGDRAGVRDP